MKNSEKHRHIGKRIGVLTLVLFVFLLLMPTVAGTAIFHTTQTVHTTQNARKTTVVPQRKGLVEFRTRHKIYQGKELVRDRKNIMLLGRDGRLQTIPLQEIQQSRSLSTTFRGLPMIELKRQLTAEFGKKYEVAGTMHYLVVAPRGRARHYAAIFESVYRTFSGILSIQRFRLDKPKFPLVAVVFPNQQTFAAYAKKDRVAVSRGLLGYYHRWSNRVALFDATAKRKTAKRKTGGRTTETIETESTNRYHARIVQSGNVKESLQATIIHEATHQVAFNVGLHSRTAETPKWIVEGLATAFEAPGIHNRTGARGAKTRINRGRFMRFGNFVRTRRVKNSLSAVIGSDSLFRTNVYDAYAESWALTFFLMETRSAQYARYLRKIAARGPFQPYTSTQRIADFKKIFGNNLSRLERDYLQFIDRLK